MGRTRRHVAAKKRRVRRRPASRKARAAKRSPTSPAPVERVPKGLQPEPRDGTVVRPSWRRYFQVYATLLQEGMPVTESAIAKVLGISRMSLWRIHRRNPGLRPWVNQQFGERNTHLVGPVVNMLGTMAIRTKSPKHAELFLRTVGALSPGAGGAANGDGEDSPEDSRYVMHVNILVPCPQVPNGGRMPALGTAPTSSTVQPQLPNGGRVPELGPPASSKMPNLNDIPTVALR